MNIIALTTVEIPPLAESLDGNNARIAVAVVAFAAFSCALMQTLVIPLLVQFPHVLNTSATTVSWLVTAMLLSGAVANVIFGRLGDMFGKRRIILVCLLFLITGSLIGSFTNNVGWLIAARALQGVAIAVIPLGISCLGELLKGASLVKAITLISAMAGMGASLGYIVSAALAQFFDWHVLFAVSTTLGIIAAVGIWRYIPALPSSGARSFDVIGAFGLALGLGGLLLGISYGSRWGWTSVLTGLCLSGGLGVLLLWGKYELSIKNPVVDLRIAAHPSILITNIATVLVGFVMYGTVLTLPQIIQLPIETGYGFGMPIIMTGLVFLPGAFISLMMPGLAGWITAAYGPRTTMLSGGLSLASGYLLLLFAHTHIFSLVSAYVFVACGVYFCFGAAPTLIMRSAPRSVTGQANGLNNLARSLGTTTSNAVSGALMAGLTITVGAHEYPSELAFIAVFCICILASLSICALLFFVRAANEHTPVN